LADGDVRNAVNNLQTVSLSLHGELTLQGIKDTLDYIEIDKIDVVYKECKNNIASAWKYIDSLISDGFSVDEIVNAFYKYGLDATVKMSDQERAKYLKVVAQAHSRIASGIGTQLQLGRMLSELGENK
jgi:DNA polymerase III gamma/tau subunit